MKFIIQLPFRTQWIEDENCIYIICLHSPRAHHNINDPFRYHIWSIEAHMYRLFAGQWSSSFIKYARLNTLKMSLKGGWKYIYAYTKQSRLVDPLFLYFRSAVYIVEMLRNNTLCHISKTHPLTPTLIYTQMRSKSLWRIVSA